MCGVRTLILAGLICWLPYVASAAELEPESINSAELSADIPDDSNIHAVTIKAQVLLDRAGFSPGEIDGKLGQNAKKALRAFAEINNISFNSILTGEVWAKLKETASAPVLTTYKISAEDVKGPFTSRIPTKMEDMKDLPALNYRNPQEAIAEKFHMSEELLKALNPKTRLDQIGQTITVAGVISRKLESVVRLEVDKTQQTVRAYTKVGALAAFYPASIGSEEKPTPSGTLRVMVVRPNPTYRYNPDYKFKGVKSKSAFTIKPGPNNPVGSIWIEVSGDGYGIHGTPEPAKVSKTESHGCVRLTNWDAQSLGSAVKRGVPVKFIDGT